MEQNGWFVVSVILAGIASAVAWVFALLRWAREPKGQLRQRAFWLAVLAVSLLVGLAGWNGVGGFLTSGVLLMSPGLAAIAYRIWDARTVVDATGRPPAAAAESEAQAAATRLIRLCAEVDKAHKTLDYDTAVKKQKEIEVSIRGIGETLFDHGGEALMLETCEAVAERSTHGRYLEGAWNRIGTWMG